MIGYVLLLLLVIHLEVSNAMQLQIGSSEWEGAVAERRLVLESQTPLESPVPSRHSRTNHSLVAAIVVLMVVATAALICCCYMWEQQLRERMEARNHREPASLSLQDSVGGSTHHHTNSRMVRLVSLSFTLVTLTLTLTLTLLSQFLLQQFMLHSGWCF